MNIRQHNAIEIAEHTKKAFQLFSKRSLAKQIIQLLEKNKIKKQAAVSQSQIALELEQTPLEGFSDKKNYYEQNESISKNTTHINKQTTTLNREQSTTKITELSYGDYVIIDIEILKEQCRIYSHLDSLKLFNTKDIPPNIFNIRKSAFQILCPTLNFKEEGENLTERSMICLKNVFTGCYVHLTSEISKSKEFGYEIQLKPELDKSGLFRFSQGQGGDAIITTDEEVSITSYYRQDLKIFISEEQLIGKIDRSLIASYSQLFFKLTKLEDTNNLTSNPFYYLYCIEIDKNIEIQEPNLQKFTIKKQIRELQLQESVSSEKSPAINQCDEFYELTPIRQCNLFRISENKPLNLCQIWQIQKMDVKQETLLCRIRSVISNQELGSESKDNGQSLSNFKRNSILQLRKQDKNQYMILNDQNANLAIIYNPQTQHYILKYEQDNTFQNQSLLSKTYCSKFELVELQPNHTNTIYQLMELHEVLKKNYVFIQKWGFRHEDRIDKIKYSLIELKKYSRLMRKKIKEVNTALDNFQAIMKKEENNLLNIQNIAKQLKLLQLLILYCQIIKLKIGKPSESQQREIYKFASSQLKPTLFKIFDLIFLLTYHNKLCSQVIIEHNIIFNQLLKDYSESIGCIIQQAIKNLCILTNKIIGEEDVIFSWTAHIQQITDPQLFNIQKQYIDIISEVIVDPNDIGIHPYQYKIKEQLIGNRKKKILPKFALSSEKSDGVNQPLIIFQYGSFPIAQIQKENGSRTLITAFQLKNLFKDRKSIDACKEEIGYISSMLKLMRNLCKDRNKKLSKIMQDYGLSIEFMHSVFKNRQISWEIITKFLDLYCVMYIVQDPFLCFQKREVKCYAWQKISNFDFSLKTGILFNQFTQENIAVEKHHTFDINILPIFDNYFQDFQKLSQAQIDHSKIQSFYNIISIIYEIVNYGYLNHRSIQRYVKKVLRFSDIVIRKEFKSERKEKIVIKAVQLLTISEEIWTIIQGMNLLLLNYQNLKQSKLTSNQYLKDIFSKALNYDQSILQEKPSTNTNPKNRKTSFNIKNSSRQATVLAASQQAISDHSELDSEIIQYTLKKIVENRFAINSKSLQSLLNLLEITTKRGERICDFLDEIFILNNPQAEDLYLEYSGIVPLQSNASAKLLNVMKVKELVDKITEENLEIEDQTRKKEKILELKYLLMKIIKKLEILKTSNYRLFNVCQTLLKKLNLHSILIEIVKHHDKEHYQALISEIILFFLQFTNNNEENLLVVSQYFPLFTKKYSYDKLPQLLPALFTKVANKQESFWLIYRNIDKKMDDPHKQILFESIHNIIKICPHSILDHVKGQIIYNLITNSKFDDYIKGVIQSPSFVNIVCFIGKSSNKIAQRIKESISKTALFQGLIDKSKSFILKSIYLKLYHFLYISEDCQIDEIEIEELIQKVFLNELKHLPSSCHSRASMRLEQLKSARSSKEVMGNTAHEIQNIVAEYSNLMLEGSETVAISEEEHYFLYLLNIKNEDQLSLLTCLKEILKKFQIIGIDPLSSYIFKLINFMQRIFMKEEKVYQSRILNKLYEISSLIQQKYNRSHQRQSTTHFKTAYSKVEAFFKKFSKIIQEENISYSKILKCGNVHYSDIQQFRNYDHRQRLVLQSQFLHFMEELVDNMNNRQQFLQLASEGTMKQFFILYSQKDSHRINIIKFISKLIETLEFQKNTAMCKHYNESRKIDEFQEPKNEEKPEQEAINCELLRKELFYMKDVFFLHLKNFMTERIKNKLDLLFHQAESQTFPDFLSLSSHNILEIHMKNSEYSIMNLIIDEILKNVNFSKLLESLNQKSWEKYFTFLASVLEKSANIYIIRIMTNLYEAIENNPAVFPRFLSLIKGFISKCYSLIEEERISQEINTFTVYSQLYALLSKIMRNKLICEDEGEAIERCVGNHFVVVFQRYIARPNSYWGNQCCLMLKTILSSFKNYKCIAHLLAESSIIVTKFQQMISKALNNGVTNTNTDSQQSIKIMNNIIHLLIKFRSKYLTAELGKIMIRWPYKSIISVFQKNYAYISEIKYKSNEECEMKYACSKEFCNFNILTEYDNYLMEVLTNLLLVIHIGSEIITTKELLKEVTAENKEILSTYSMLRQEKNGEKQYKPNSFGKYWRIIKAINMKVEQKNEIFYFSLPYNEQLKSQQLQNQVQVQLNSINKQNYFHNLYHISFYIQNQYQQMRLLDQGCFSKYIVQRSNILQYLFLIYLAILCFNKIFTGFSIPIWFVYFFNTFIIIVKSVLFVIQGRKLFYEHRLLSEVKYDKNLKVWKYSQFLLCLLAIMSYCIQSVREQFYAVTFTLQLMKIKQVQKAIVMLGKMLRSVFYLILFVQALLVSCAFLLYQKKKNMGNSAPLIDTYLNLIREIILLQFMPIEMGDPQSFLNLKSKPQLLPIIDLTLIYIQAVILAMFILQLLSDFKNRKEKHNKCDICGFSKQYIECTGKNYQNHIGYEHNVWNYIEFFIYIRSKGNKEVEEMRLSELIEKHDFRFLKV